MPKPGIGPRPRPKIALNITCAKQVKSKHLEGVRMLPEPRMTAANELVNQMQTAPANTTRAYSKHCSSASSLPPNAEKMEGPKRLNNKVKKSPIPKAMSAAWSTKALAFAELPDPKARLMADVMPPPIEPADNICCNMTNGNTKAMPAKDMMPN